MSLFAKKIFPFATPTNPKATFKILFLAEGFQQSEKRDFIDGCTEFVKRLKDTTPFNTLHSNKHSVQIYYHFEASNSTGPAIDIPAIPGSTTFESSLNTTTQHLSFGNLNNLQQIIQNLKIRDGLSNDLDFSNFLKVERYNKGVAGTLIVILLPELIGVGGQYENRVPGSGEYHFVATSMDGEWPQVVIRVMAKLFGLGDEYEEPGPDFETPGPIEGALMQYTFPNLTYIYNSSIFNISPSFKWFKYLSPNEQVSFAQPNQHPSGGLLPEGPPNTPWASYFDKFEIYEGGGGFRKRIFRPYKDCLMRREVGSTLYPLKEKRVPFCKVCENYLRLKLK